VIKTLKFGGTSVGTASNMRKVANIITTEKATLTVLSAMSGTTDSLVRASDSLKRQEEIDFLRNKYTECINELLSNKQSSLDRLEEVLAIVASDTTKQPAREAQGELITTFIFAKYLNERGENAKLLYAPDFMEIDDMGAVVNTKLNTLKEVIEPNTIYITQGFIATIADGTLGNLGRGGSDYSAALMGVAIGSSEVQIWTDIDGMHTGDPRFVRGTRPIRRMSFDEAAELAYFGAKILHPATVIPCKEAGVDVRLKNTMDPIAEGTLISSTDESAMNFHAVAAKDNITLIRISSARMLMAYGFLRRVFEVFEKYKTPIDMITTSEVAVSLTVDNVKHLIEIKKELKEMATVEVEHNNTIVCVVGRIDQEHAGLAARVFKAVENIPIKMISYGASHRSMALLINSQDKIPTLQSLNNFLF